MSEEKGHGKLVVYAILFVILFFGLLRIFITGGKYFLRLELLGFLFLLLLTLIGFVGYAKAWGERVFFFVFLFYIGNLVLLWYFSRSLYMVLLLASLIGFLMSIPKRIERGIHHPISDYPKPEAVSASQVAASEPQHSVVLDKTVKATKKKTTKKPTTHSPGKYVASNLSNIYHEPKCDWAKKIHRSRRIWFKKKEDAWEKGYRAHSCVD